jgi:hypothetical protein
MRSLHQYVSAPSAFNWKFKRSRFWI